MPLLPPIRFPAAWLRRALPALLVLAASPAVAEPPTCNDPEVVEILTLAFDLTHGGELDTGIKIDAAEQALDFGPEPPPNEDWVEARGCAMPVRLANGEAFALRYRVLLYDAGRPTDFFLDTCFERYDPALDDCTGYPGTN